MQGQSGWGHFTRCPSPSGSYSLQTSNGEADLQDKSSSRSFDSNHDLPGDECSSSGAPDDFTLATAKVDVGFPPDFGPRKAYAWNGVNAPV